VRVQWTHTAIAHLLGIYEHIARDVPIYAQRIVDRLTRRSEQIATLPQSGRVVPEYGAPDIREAIERPCRIIYRIREEQIDVLAVVHSAQMLPPERTRWPAPLSLGRVCRACGHAWGCKSPVQVCVEPKDKGSARASPRGGG
jgi:toxin ParE1/3/4